MKHKAIIPFDITSIDSLGQGVSKVTDKIVFIPKTAPGDKGEAWVMSEKKGVAFGRVKELEKKSPDRIIPACVHFNQCPSCHFQHVNYEQELVFKKESFLKLFRKFSIPNLEVIPAPERYHYRNRIQLHYSLKTELLGMRDPQTFAITEIPQCIIGLPQIKKEIDRLYDQKTWMKEAPSHPLEGHVEIYWIEEKLKVSWNRPYAEGGFSQVNSEMNEKLKSQLRQEWASEAEGLLDLFGGNGNLSNDLKYSQRLCVDMYKSLPSDSFFNQDLYEKNALSKVQYEVKKRKLSLSHLLLDPPRSGLKNLNEWLEALKPSFVAYVSCDPHTLARDLQNLSSYSLGKAFLIDFFPSTFHYESMIFLERNR